MFLYENLHCNLQITLFIAVTTTQDLLTSLPLNPGSPGLPGKPIDPLSPLVPSFPYKKIFKKSFLLLDFCVRQSLSINHTIDLDTQVNAGTELSTYHHLAEGCWRPWGPKRAVRVYWKCLVEELQPQTRLSKMPLASFVKSKFVSRFAHEYIFTKKSTLDSA